MYSNRQLPWLSKCARRKNLWEGLRADGEQCQNGNAHNNNNNNNNNNNINININNNYY